MLVEKLLRIPVGIQRTPRPQIVRQIVHPRGAVAVSRRRRRVDKARAAAQRPFGQLPRAAEIVAEQVVGIALGRRGTGAEMEHVGEVAERAGFFFQSVVKLVRLDELLESQRREVAPLVVGAELVDHDDAVRSVPTIERPGQNTADESGATGHEEAGLTREFRTAAWQILFGGWFLPDHDPHIVAVRCPGAQTPSHCQCFAAALTFPTCCRRAGKRGILSIPPSRAS